MIADAVAQARARAFDEHEAILRDQLKTLLPPNPELDNETRQRLAPFIDWCAKTQVRHCPARAFVVAAFVFNQAALKVGQRDILAQTEAIARLHDHFGLSNPVATQAVRYAIQNLTAIEPPRSWTNAEKLEFASLPPEVQAAIARREAGREKALRQAQNEAADLRAESRKQNTATANQTADTEKEKETTMAKKEGWQKGEGPYSKSDDVKLRQVAEPPFTKGRDISKVVDANNDRSEGFSAKLDNPE